MAQISLSRIPNEKTWILPILGTRNVSRMEEKLKAVKINLTTEEQRALNEALDKLNLVDISTMRMY